ncbi:MAG: hypothetical protein AAGC85_24445 [Bacteroidota bacterium]
MYSFIISLLLTFSISTDPHPLVGTKFPDLTVERLSREEITLPDALTQQANILALVFERESQYKVDTWAEFIISDHEAKPEVSYHEIPMISSFFKLASGWIDNGMRSGINPKLHDNVATFYGDRDPYFEGLQMSDKSSIYVFILDEEGIIRYREEGMLTPEKRKGFEKVLAQLTSEELSRNN